MSVKAMSAVENSEGAAQKKLANASRDPIRLVRLLRGIEANGATEHGDLGVAEIAYDSRKVRPGTLFVAIHGEKTDGNKFVSDAMARGAIAILSEQARPEPTQGIGLDGGELFRTSRRSAEACRVDGDQW